MAKSIQERVTSVERKVKGLCCTSNNSGGTQGPQGPQGIQGIPGTPGAVGPAGLEWQGAWVSETSYVADDAVGYDGASWFCILATSGTTTPDVDTTHWALLASQGAQGPQGEQGPTGPQGPIGVTGTQGESYNPNELVIESTNGYILTSADSGKIIIFKTTTSQTLTISTGLVDGFECTFVTLAGVTLTVVSTGNTLNNATSSVLPQQSSFTLKRMIATDTFIATGNL